MDLQVVCTETREPRKAIDLLSDQLIKLQSVGINARGLLITENPIQTPGGIDLISGLKINSLEYYSRFVLVKLGSLIQAPKFMIVQLDGYIIDIKSWTPEFLDYDYIGAPWPHNPGSYKGYPPIGPNNDVGNGGFSIRSKKLMERVSQLVQTTQANLTETEDCCICRVLRPQLEADGFKFASSELATKFSTEDKPYRGSLGFHGNWTYNWLRTSDQYNKLLLV